MTLNVIFVRNLVNKFICGFTKKNWFYVSKDSHSNAKYDMYLRVEKEHELDC